MPQQRKQIVFVKTHIKNELRTALMFGNTKTQIYTLIKCCNKNYSFKSQEVTVNELIADLLGLDIRSVQRSIKALCSTSEYVERLSKYEIKISPNAVSMVKEDVMRDLPSDDAEIESIIEKIDPLIPSYATTKIQSAQEKEMIRIENYELKKRIERLEKEMIGVKSEVNDLKAFKNYSLSIFNEEQKEEVKRQFVVIK